MKMNSKVESNISQYPKYLWFLILSYSMVLAMSNWYDSRIILIFGMSITPGALIYPITFLLSNMITEVYGFKNARLAILTALLFNLIFIIYGQIIMALPTQSGAGDLSSFDSFLSVNLRIIAACFISCLISEPLDAFIVSKLKIALNGGFIGIRFILSTLISGIFDSISFILIAFYNIMPNNEIIGLILHIWMIKTVVELLGLPITIRLTNKLKQIEKLDIYDTDTKFNIFNLDINYTESNNKFDKIN